MMKKTHRTIAAILATGLVLGACWANELQNGSFETPDNEAWAESSWNSWTPGDRSGRTTWAKRTGARGAGAWGWNDASEMGIYQDVPGGPNISYTYTVWVKKEINYNEDETLLNIEWLDDELNWVGGNVYSNITGLAGTSYSQFIVTGSTTNTNCSIVRVVIYTRWNNPASTLTATMQFDDAELIAVPATVIQMK